jgi:hypothetical protein
MQAKEDHALNATKVIATPALAKVLVSYFIVSPSCFSQHVVTI